MKIDLTTLVPWELTLKINGVEYATRKPTWADVIELDAVEKAVKAARESGDREQLLGVDDLLRGGLKRFFQARDAQAVDSADSDDVQAAFAACSAYYTDWAKKKQADAIATVRPATPTSQPQPGRP